jgi:hypothetical protein
MSKVFIACTFRFSDLLSISQFLPLNFNRPDSLVVKKLLVNPIAPVDGLAN